MTSIDTFLDAVAHPLALARDGRVVRANAACRTLLGYDPCGAPLDSLELPAGIRAHREQPEEGAVLCSFVREDVRLGELLAHLSADEASQLLLGHRHDPVSITDAQTGLFVDVNDAWVAQYGYTREEAVDVLGPTDVSADPEATRAAVQRRPSEDAIAPHDLRWHRKKDGTVFPVEIQCGAIRIRDRDLVFARLHDVAERTRAEEARRRSEQNHRTLIEQLPHAVFVHRDEHLLYVNPAARRLLGFAPDDAMEGMRLFDLVHPEDRALATNRVRDHIYRGEPVPALEERLVRRDGSIVPVEVVALPTLFDGAPAGIALAQDITLRKDMEARLVTSDRLASLGRLAASVGHEINNPLMYILGSLELLRHELQKGAPRAHDVGSLLERVDAAEQGTLRVRDVVRDLRSLARSPEEDSGPAELERTLDACVQMASHELRHRARLVRVPANGPVWVQGSEARLGQVFLNLLVNAAQAIEVGSHEDNVVELRVRPDGRDGIVEILDTGRGLPPGAEAHLFEPFYTTKRGTGTGLGLSICLHIVSALEGRIEVERRDPRGTLFRVRIPLADPPADSLPSHRRGPVDGASRRILIVDDEPEICRVMARWLAGYDVRVAHSGREALERIEREGPFDLVVCDLMMGDVTGMDVHARLAADPDFVEERLVFTTGGAYTERARRFAEARANRMLLKPFRRDDVLGAVERALAQSAH